MPSSAHTAAGPTERASPGATPLAMLVMGLVIGALVPLSLQPTTTSSVPAGTQGLEAQLAALNQSLANLTRALEAAQAQARLADVAANQAGLTELVSRFSQVDQALAEGERAEAFEPLQALVSASGNTSWAPLLRADASRVHAAADRVYDRLSLGTLAEANASMADLRAAVAALRDLFQEVYLPFHGTSPVGSLVEATANMSGFFVAEASGGVTRNPTLHLTTGGRMLVEVTNNDAVNHSFVVLSLRLASPAARPGETVGLVIGPAPAGNYRYFCDVPGHEATMNGILSISA